MAIEFNEKIIGDYCKANGIKKLSLFGSFSKNSFNADSDIDLLVEFEDNMEYGLLDISRMENELTEIVRRKVDLRTPDELSRYFRENVVKEAQVKYGK
ncbi:MAG: nucleotidyltransferase domain-containing protein [bacterium]